MCAYSKQMGFGQLHQRVLFCAKNTCFVVVVVVAFLQPLLSYGLVGDGWECLWISVGHCEFLSQFVRLLVAAHAYACTCMPACAHMAPLTPSWFHYHNHFLFLVLCLPWSFPVPNVVIIV